MTDKPEKPRVDSLPNGRMVDKYKIVKLLGQGGMGAVYQAVDTSSGKEDDFVAIKVLFPHLAMKSGDFTQRFLREARIASKISHPNMVAVLESNFCEDGEFYYIVQEYVGGGTLKQLVTNDTVLLEEDTLTVAIGVARALEAAHKFNVVHRDIKPDNIMFGNDGTVKVADWGIAKRIATDESAVSVTTLELTAAKIFMGTPLYASPEQIQDTKNVDIRSDIYSLGATMYYSLVGKPPFRGSTEVESLCVILTKPPPDVRRARPDVSEKTAAMINRMLAKTAAERFQNPTELLEALIDAAKSTALFLHPGSEDADTGDACAGRMRRRAPDKTVDSKKSVQSFPEDFHTMPLASVPEKTPVVAEVEAERGEHTAATRYASPAKAAAITPLPATSPEGAAKKRFPVGKLLLGVMLLAVFFGGIWFVLRSLQTMKSQFEDNLQRRLDEARELASNQRKDQNAGEGETVSPPDPTGQKEKAAEQARQEEAAKLAAEQAAEKARQEEAAKLAAEKARQEAAAKLAAEQAAKKAIPDSQLQANIKKILAGDESSLPALGPELSETCLQFRDALTMFDQSRQKLARDLYFRSTSSAMEFVVPMRLLWETAREPRQEDARQVLSEEAYQRMEACLQQTAENLVASIAVMRLPAPQRAQARLYFLRVLAFCDEVSDGRISAWQEDFPSRQAVSAFFPDVLLLEAIAKDDVGQLGVAPSRIAWLQPFLQPK